MDQFITLGEFIIDRQSEIPGSTGNFSRLLSAIRLGAKIVSQQINKAGLVKQIMGASGTENVQGETQQKLDVYANNQFIKALQGREVICGIASEENDEYIALNPDGHYIVSMDPLDGSSNIDVNVSVGTIFSVYQRKSPIGQAVTRDDFLQPGTAQICAGYVIYGSSTMLVYTTGNGVNGFTFDPGTGVFFLSHPKMTYPEAGRIYSMNEGNINQSPKGVQEFIGQAQKKNQELGYPLTGRYIGSLVADFHRNLIKGGIYLYPSTDQSPNGKLRLLYECNPLAFIAEQAGGMASSGSQRILEIQPTELHQRVPYYVGNRSMVEKLETLIATKMVSDKAV